MAEELKKKRHRLTNMRYDEISFVDRGANQHANVMIVKREPVSKTSVDATGVHPQRGGSTKSSGGGGRKADWYASDRAPTESGSGKGKKSERAMHWKEDKHPRNAKGSGSPRGGTFKKTSAASKKKYGKGGTTAAKQKAAGKTTTTTKTVSYKVKKGDTLWDLAKKYYGDPQKWKTIAKANGIKDPRKMPTGITLKIPGVKVTSTKKTAKKKASSSASTGEHLAMEAGGKVHWEKNKAVHQKTTTTKTKAEIAAQKKYNAKLKAERLRRQREARKKVLVKKRVTEVDKIAARNMFAEYLEGR